MASLFPATVNGLLLLVLAGVIGAAKLPSYVGPPCSRSAPEAELSKCCQDRANNGLRTLGNGDRKLRIPSMRPLSVPRIALAQGSNQIGLNITWEPAMIAGLPESKISNMVNSFVKKHTSFDVLIPEFTLSGNYTSTGRVLLLPITGAGPSFLVVRNLKCHYEYDWPLKKGVDGKDYANIINGQIKIIGAESMKVKFDGLFGGDKLLGGQMNIFLNENWQELMRDIGPSVAEAIGEVVQLVVKGLADHVPIDELFAQ